MGGCLSQGKTHIYRGQTIDPLPSGQESSTIQKNLLNPELTQTFQKSSVEQSSNTAPSTVNSDEKMKSIMSLQEALQKSKVEIDQNVEGQNLQAWIESHNTTSSIIKIHKNKPKKSKSLDFQEKHSINVFRRLQSCENMNGDLKTQGHVDKIILTNDYMDIEFMLPRSRAGPLVVPYISYEKFDTSHQ